MAVLDDRVFVALARKVGYPSEPELQRCRRIQLERIRGGRAQTLFDTARAEGVLDANQVRRYERWADQIARRDAAPITDTMAPGPIMGVAQAEQNRVIFESAETAANEAARAPKCERCGADLDDIALVEGRAREVGDRRECTACFAAPAPRAAPPPPGTTVAPSPLGPRAGSAARVPAATKTPSASAPKLDLAPVAPPPPKKKARVREILESSAETIATFVTRKPRKKAEDQEAPEPPPNVPAIVATSVVVTLLVVAIVVPVGFMLFRKPPAPRPSPTPPPPRPTVADAPPPPPPPPAGQPKAYVPAATDERGIDEAKKLIAQGRFEAALQCANAVAEANANAPLGGVATDLAQRARLLWAVTRTLRPTTFQRTADLVAVTLESGVTHVARVLAESPTVVLLSLSDGRELEVKPARISRRTSLGADGWVQRVRARVERRLEALGGEAPAVELYAVAADALENGVPEVGVPLLERALARADGGAVVDAHGAGDLDELHRARTKLAASGETAALPPPAPPPPPPPTVTPEDAPPPEPEKPIVLPEGSETAGLTDNEKLQLDPSWTAARESYRRGLELYKASFAGRTAQEKKGIREARSHLEKARAQLDKVPQDAGAAEAWDAFSAQVNALLRDVKKRQAATGP